MYCGVELGRFTAPEPGYWRANPEHGIFDIRYIPEPPVQVRGGFNPWELERKREQYIAEEAAWRKIQAEQALYRSILKKIDALIREFNRIGRELEELTGKKQGNMFSANNIASFIAGSSGNPYIMGILAVKMVVEMFLGNQKKKKIDALVRQLEHLQAQILALYRQLTAIQDRIMVLTQEGERVRQGQAVKVHEAITKFANAYQVQQVSEAQRGAALAAKNRQAMLRFPTRQGGYDAL